MDICELPSDTGPCRALIPRWFFDTRSGKCQRFTFGGCQGNANNFETLEECINTCGELIQKDIQLESAYIKLYNLIVILAQ